MLKVAFIN